jgi:osmotically-inducible protein OsmY
MSAKTIIFLAAGLALFGCGMSDQELHDRTGDAAVAAKRAAEGAGDTMKSAYDSAAAKGKEALGQAGEKLSDVALRAKVLAGFKLVAGLEADQIEVEVRDQVVYLKGAVPTELDKMKAEGVAFGVTGDRSKFVSELQVKTK